jgi:hypothetical protein
MIIVRHRVLIRITNVWITNIWKNVIRISYYDNRIDTLSDRDNLKYKFW